MHVDRIMEWLAAPTHVKALAEATRGQMLACLIRNDLIPGGTGRPTWVVDAEWYAQLIADVHALDARITAASSPEQVLSAISMVLSVRLCGGLSVPTR